MGAKNQDLSVNPECPLVGPGRSGRDEGNFILKIGESMYCSLFVTYINRGDSVMGIWESIVMPPHIYFFYFCKFKNGNN